MSEDLEQVFVSLVKESWKQYNESIYNARVDDILVGAVIHSNVELGYSLIDLTSDGVYHYLRFEHLASRQRVIFELRNLSEDLITARVLGRRARVVIGYGCPVQNFGTLWQTLKAEFKSGFVDAAEPGVITCDADVSSGYIYAQVPLLFELDKYIGNNYQINYQLLQHHINATVHSLAKYLQGRLQA